MTACSPYRLRACGLRTHAAYTRVRKLRLGARLTRTLSCSRGTTCRGSPQARRRSSIPVSGGWTLWGLGSTTLLPRSPQSSAQPRAMRRWRLTSTSCRRSRVAPRRGAPRLAALLGSDGRVGRDVGRRPARACSLSLPSAACSLILLWLDLYAGPWIIIIVDTAMPLLRTATHTCADICAFASVNRLCIVNHQGSDQN